MKFFLIAIGVGSLAVLGGIAMYYSYKTQQQHQQSQPQQSEEIVNLKKQLEQLKGLINVNNPSYQDAKQIAKFSLKYNKIKMSQSNQSFVKKRKSYSKQKIINHMQQYLNMLFEQLQTLSQIPQKSQQQVFTYLGVNQYSLVKYQQQLAIFMRNQMRNLQNNSNQLTKQQMKEAIQLCIQLAKSQGNKLIDKIIQAGQDWDNQKKQNLLIYLNIVIEDCAFENRPDIDAQALQNAQIKYHQYINAIMKQYRNAYEPLHQKLKKGLNMQFYQQNGMDQMQQQLMQLQQTDPQQFQELRKMYMMSQHQ